ncbi:MAG: protein-L-isoaspartate(D-aspartate) O-methyltransferase [Planctomycetes bacterium]|nr:protein-L-isoaspartate(D-aspartate) O-methyltransferase [Planctomycetota bacterium]
MIRVLRTYGIRDESVLGAMTRIPRSRFVPAPFTSEAYIDSALPIGHDQTISQPYIVAAMTEAVVPSPDDRALDVGTGSGYQAAVLAELVREVHSVERIPELVDPARERLDALGYTNVHLHLGDGAGGWPEASPYDIIIVACCCRSVPSALREQLAVGGRLCLPVGEPDGPQVLQLITRVSETVFETESLTDVRFVPMVPGVEAR